MTRIINYIFIFPLIPQANRKQTISGLAGINNSIIITQQMVYDHRTEGFLIYGSFAVHITTYVGIA